uniref:DDE_Tnp_IS1595 domain-containing protein n=1 Tax=Ascaris lumbricoides TaxID=6252 RepID=A0A0M3ICP9_ASCLU
MSGKIDLACLFKLKFLSEMSGEGQLQVLDFCMHLGIIAKEYTCPECGKKMSLHERPGVIDKYEWVCRKYGPSMHYVKRSVRKGSWFSESRLSIVDLLLMTEFFVRNRSQDDVMYELGLSNGTVCDWRSLFREVCVQFCINESCKIGGMDKIVDIDECAFGRRKFRRAKRIDGKWVIAGVERGSNKFFFSVVQSKNIDTLLDVIQTFVLPGSVVFSVCWKTYGCLKNEAFRNFAQSHSIEFKNSTESAWSAVRKQLPRRTVTEQFDSYLAEYLWRRSHTEVDDLMCAFLEAVRLVYIPHTSDVLDE